MKVFSCVVLTLLSLPAVATAEEDATLPEAPSALTAVQATGFPLERQPHPKVTVLGVPRAMLSDGYHILVSPSYLRPRDLMWAVPLAGATAAAFATDTKTMTQVVSQDVDFNNAATNASHGLVGGLIAAPAVLFAYGHLKGDEKARETGILAGEAVADSLIVAEVAKLTSYRERPYLDQGRGSFLQTSVGADSSFFSSHAVVAWSSAAVMAAEYPTWWKQALVYTAASGVSVTRVMAQQHFPSDVLIGSAAGWLIGHYVYRAHHHAR